MTETQVFPPQWQDEYEFGEAVRVHKWRYWTARDAGLTRRESERFANGNGITASLRSASTHGATHDQLVRIFCN